MLNRVFTQLLILVLFTFQSLTCNIKVYFSIISRLFPPHLLVYSLCLYSTLQTGNKHLRNTYFSSARPWRKINILFVNMFISQDDLGIGFEMTIFFFSDEKNIFKSTIISTKSSFFFKIRRKKDHETMWCMKDSGRIIWKSGS